MELDALRELMHERLNDRDIGTVLCDISRKTDSGESDQQRLSAYLLSQFGLAVAPDRIKELKPDIASAIAERVLAGLTKPPRRTRATDRELFLEFLGHFSLARRYYSPVEYRFGPSQGDITMIGNLLVGADMEEGILVVDDERIGILWMGDCS